MDKTTKVWVVFANHNYPYRDSCSVKSIYLNKEKAEKWVKEENEKLEKYFYWIEESQLIE